MTEVGEVVSIYGDPKGYTVDVDEEEIYNSLSPKRI